METKSLTPIRTQASKVLTIANALSITNDSELALAVDVMHNIKNVQKEAEAAKKKITDPLNEALKSARALFAPIEEMWKDAELIVKTKMSAFYEKVSAERAKKEAELAARVEKGTLKIETAAKKLDAIPEAQTSVQGKKGEIQFRTVRKVIFTDFSQEELYNGNGAKENILHLVKEGYLVWDEVKARKEVLAGKELYGTKVVEEKIIAAY